MGVITSSLSVANAFLGYALYWGQFSFYGLTTTINLLLVMVFMGTYTVHTLCGGYIVVILILSRFYSLRFILTLVVLWL